MSVIKIIIVSSKTKTKLYCLCYQLSSKTNRKCVNGIIINIIQYADPIKRILSLRSTLIKVGSHARACTCFRNYTWSIWPTTKFWITEIYIVFACLLYSFKGICSDSPISTDSINYLKCACAAACVGRPDTISDRAHIGISCWGYRGTFVGYSMKTSRWVEKWHYPVDILSLEG